MQRFWSPNSPFVVSPPPAAIYWLGLAAEFPLHSLLLSAQGGRILKVGKKHEASCGSLHQKREMEMGVLEGIAAIWAGLVHEIVRNRGEEGLETIG